MTTYDELISTAKSSIEAIVAKLDKGEDLIPCLAIDGDSHILAMIPQLAESQETKAIVAQEVIPKVLRDSNATQGALHLPAWVKVSTDPALARLIRPSMDPDRQECVVLLTFNHDREDIHMAHITRSDDGVTIGEWKTTEGSSGERGLFQGFSRYCRP